MIDFEVLTQMTTRRRSVVKSYEILQAANFLCLEVFLCIHDMNQQDSINKFQVCHEEFKALVNKFLLDKRLEEGYIAGMSEDDFVFSDGKKIWDKALAVRRKINNVLLPAFNRNLVKDALPSGKNIDEIMKLTLETLENDSKIQKARIESADATQQSQADQDDDVDDDEGNDPDEQIQAEGTRTKSFKAPNEWIAFTLRAKPAKFYLTATNDSDIYKHYLLSMQATV